MATAGSAFCPNAVLRSAHGGVPQAALPGHRATALAGRRDGTGARFGFISLRGGTSSREVKVACSKADSAAESRGKWKIDFEMMKDVESMYTALGYALEPPASLPEVMKARNKKFGELVKKSVDLLVDAFARLPHESMRLVYPPLWPLLDMYFSFIRMGGLAREGRVTWDMALKVAVSLDDLRRLVSFSWKSPLPVMTMFEYSMESDGVTDDNQEVVFALLENIFRVVKCDVEAITSPIPQLCHMFLSDEEKAMQQKLQAIAERSIGLMADALTRLPPCYRRPLSPLYMIMMVMYPAVAKVAVFAGARRAKRGMAVILAVQLDDFRRILSAVLDAPFPLTMNTPLVQVAARDDCEVALMALLENICTTVESDVDAIISSVA